MLENLLRPYLLARVLLGGFVLAALVYGAVVAARALLHGREGSSEATLALDRRAELVAALVKVSALAASLGLVATVIAADRAHESIRGAMCAYGVLTSTDHGIASLGVSGALFVASVAWLALHRLDQRLVRGDLTRRKLAGAVALAPLALVDLVYVTRFVTELDFDVVASCCSASADTGGGASGTYGLGGSYPVLVAATLALAAGASLLVVSVRRRARALRAFAAVVLFAGAALSLPAVIDVVAPHVYGSPLHRCPFCLLHAEAGFIGYPLLAASMLAIAGATSVLVGALHAARFPDAAHDDARATLFRTTTGALVVIALMLAPLLRYAALSGTLLSL